MFLNFRISFLLFLSFLPFSYNSFLWQIIKNPPSYLFGTIHVPYLRVWDCIPQNVKRAFEQSDSVFFELDLTNPSTVSDLSACQYLPHGRRVHQVIPISLYFRLQKHLFFVKKNIKKMNLNPSASLLFSSLIKNWEKKQPIWITLLIHSLTSLELSGGEIPVLDYHLSQLASQLQKEIGAIERVSDQCRPLNQLNSTQVIFALNQTLRVFENAESPNQLSSESLSSTNDLIQSYNNGNLSKFLLTQNQNPIFLPLFSESQSEKSMAQSIEDSLRDNLLLKRNKKMALRILDLLETHPHKSYFFAFGAGHYLGNHSILEYLQAAGYIIHHIEAKANLKRGSRRKKNRVQGTFEDLSELEKTRAVLQYLQKSEQSNDSRRFIKLSKLTRLTPREDSNLPIVQLENNSIIYRLSVLPLLLLLMSFYSVLLF